MDLRKHSRKDRIDGYYLDNVDSMHKIMPYLMPKRTETEAVVNETIDLTNVMKLIEEKNKTANEKYTIFHVLAAALAKTAVLRPELLRFIAGNRMYEYKEITMAFVVKNKFEDKSSESLAKLIVDENDNLEKIHIKLVNKIKELRAGNKDDANIFMDKVTSMPRWVLRIIMRILNLLDYYGKVPASITRDDPNYSGIFIANLGSINLSATYHHLNNWGTNSFFIVIGEKKDRPYFDKEGNVEMRLSLDLAITVDERISDGFYFSKSFKLLKYLLENPTLLEEKFMTEVDYE